MMRITGSADSAVIYATEIDAKAKQQVLTFLNQAHFAGSEVRIMPDVHAGAGCVIGFTARLLDKVVPNIVGVDIGCGLEVCCLGRLQIDYQRLNSFIGSNIPHGFRINKQATPYWSKHFKEKVRQVSTRVGSNHQRDLLSAGSLGGGNHFIEIAVSQSGNKYLVIHSGSRNFGLKVAEHHQKKAERLCVEQIKSNSLPRELAYLQGRHMEEYLSDMQVAVDFAAFNRKVMSKKIVEHLGLDYSEIERFTTIHNYISLQDNIIRKGAISAHQGEKVIIPLNMRDGSLIALGKGCAEWNYSAPHGAGRILSRRAAKKSLSMAEFKQEMKSVYTTSVTSRTLDESPMAYKPIKKITSFIQDTVTIVDQIRPQYNFKAH